MSSATSAAAVEVRGPTGGRRAEIVTAPALELVARLEQELGGERRRLLERRQERRDDLLAGALPAFLDSTRGIRESEWRIPPAPADLAERKVEITGPVDRKMMINALNSGASCFMADLEDATAPTWANVVDGQANLVDAVAGTLAFDAPDGREYRLGEETATLLVRPRGWHLVEKHVLVQGRAVSASFFDFALYVFHNAGRLLERGTAPYLYLPKLESHLEARLWNDAFELVQDALGLPRGTIRATVLVETILAAFEMDEILHELGPHASALNAGRWDYIFSVIKQLGHRPEFVLPDRAQVTMAVPFMRAYTRLLVRTCHRRGAHAIGGMAAFIPSRRDADVNERALAKVREDKTREAGDGFDGTWVAHPDLVPVARAEFDAVLGERPNQLDVIPNASVTAEDLLAVAVPGGGVTESGLRANVSVGLRYLESWLGGVGAAAIDNLMEDAATCEIARSQLWQWTHHGTELDDGTTVTPDLIRGLVRDEHGRLAGAVGETARTLFERVALEDPLVEFLTLPAYDHLD